MPIVDKVDYKPMALNKIRTFPQRFKDRNLPINYIHGFTIKYGKKFGLTEEESIQALTEGFYETGIEDEMMEKIQEWEKEACVIEVNLFDDEFFEKINQILLEKQKK